MLLEELKRFFGMHAPSEGIRLAMYRKAGVRIGRVTGFGSNIWIDINFKNLIVIGDDVLLAGYDQILSHSFLMADSSDYGFQPVEIKRGAKIGLHCIILPGVTIGENSVVGAGALVARDIPPNCLAVGVPAKPVKYLNKSTHEERQGRGTTAASRLYVKCKTCGVEIWSAISCQKQQFKALELTANHHPCPNCGHSDQYDKKDYYFID